MRTSDVLEAACASLSPEALYVSSLGRVAAELHRLRPADTLFLDALGDVCSVALGVSVAEPGLDIVAVDTDGSFLMNLSVLTAFAQLLPVLPRLKLWLCDNQCYESAGGIPTASATLDWVLLFGAFGVDAQVIRSTDQLTDLCLEEVQTVVFDTSDDSTPMPEVRKRADGVESATMFAAAISKRTGRMRPLPAVKL